MKLALFKTLKFQVALALGVQFVLLAAVIGTTLYQLDLRKHDYIILNLAGQLRVISETIVNQSQSYVRKAPRDYSSYYRDLELYGKDLDSLVNQYDKIIVSFRERKLSPEITGQLGPIVCKWDRQSLNQLDITALNWDDFINGLYQVLGPDKAEPRLEAGAEYILAQKETLTRSSTDLANAFQLMMEGKLAQIKRLNQMAIVLSVLIAATLGLLLHFKAFRPLDKTVDGFRRVSRGDLSHQIPVAVDNEVGYMTTMFNRLTQRLAALFQLTDRINQATNLDETLQFVYQEFRGFLPIDWVGLLQKSTQQTDFTLERVYTDQAQMPGEGMHFPVDDTLLAMVLQSQRAQVKHLGSSDASGTDLTATFRTAGVCSVIALPLAAAGANDAVLVFATREAGVYEDEHLELISNISGQVSHSFDKTYGMEGLVISAVAGLAKLAESRDPETGDHLLRMSMYSAIVAQELGNDSAYSDMISPAYVRDVFRFSPMHDIGKVGVKDAILLKPGKLDDDEWTEMSRHPLIGADVLRRCEQQVSQVGYSIFQVGIEIAEGHHEKFDGSGYPHGKSGADIPLSARIVAVADVFDALTSKRPYKDAWPVEKALDVIHAESGKHFDPEVVAALERCMARIMEIYDKHKHV